MKKTTAAGYLISVIIAAVLFGMYLTDRMTGLQAVKWYFGIEFGRTLFGFALKLVAELLPD
jgi:hypothetical protein